MSRSRKEAIIFHGKRFFKMIAILIMITTLALLIECVFFQRNAIRYKETPILFTGSTTDWVKTESKETLAKLTEDEQNAIEVQRENEKLIAEYHGEVYEPEEDETLVEKDGKFYRKIRQTTLTVTLENSYYIKKLALQVPLETDGGYNLTLYQNGKETASGMFCSINSKIDTGVTNVNALADQLVIVINSQEELNPDTIFLELSNNFTINGMRLLFFVVALLIFTWLIMTGFMSGLHFGKKKKFDFLNMEHILMGHTEWVFAIICLLLGSLLILGIGTNQVGFDEYAHEKTAYDLSFATTIETTEAAMQMKGNLLPYFNNPEERELVEHYEQKLVEEIAPDITHQSRMVRTETRVYYPMAAGFYAARLLGTDFASSMALAKFGNLLMYILVVWLAIHLAKQYKLLLVLIGLLPNNIFIAASITYDAVVTAFLLLGFVLLTNELLEPHQKLKWTNLLAMLLCFEIGSLSKPIYVVMALMLVFLGKEKFENRVQEVVLKGAVVTFALLMLYNIFKPTPVSGGDYALVSNMQYAGDPRNTGSSVTGQIAYILGNPLAYTMLLLKSMGTMFWEYVTMQTPFVGYAYLGFSYRFVNWIFIALGVIAALFTSREDHFNVMSVEHKRQRHSAIGLRYVFLNLILCFGLSAIIWTSMYVSYSVVGADVIEGVQGRYFIPLFLPFFSCLFLRKSQKEKRGKLQNLWYALDSKKIYVLLIGIAVLVNLMMTYRLVITKLNI